MNSGRFLKQLRKELPNWQEQGWLTEENSQAILEHQEQQLSQSHFFASALAILGVLLLGSGIVTFFAANWNDMAKLSKLIVLFAALYLAFGIAACFLKGDKSPKVGQALLLLGVILFGANIMLIAQIYHIDSHFPNGVLLWSLGGLLTAYIMRSQAAMIASIALAILWTGMESFGFDQFHFGFLIVWFICLPIIFKSHWRASLHIALIGLLFWSFFSFFGFSNQFKSGQELYLVQFYFLAYLCLFVVGMLLNSSERFQSLSGPTQSYSIIASLFALYVLTFPDLHNGYYYDAMNIRKEYRSGASPFWIKVTVITTVVFLGLSLWHVIRSNKALKTKPRYLYVGQALVLAIIALIVLNLFSEKMDGSTMGIAFNLLFFTGVIWLVFAGMHMNNRFLINVAFMYFALGLLTRYFDTFWTLLNRSFFFMAGGLILIVGGYFLEQQRRKINNKLKQQNLEGSGA